MKSRLYNQKEQVQAMKLLKEYYEGTACISGCPLCRAIESWVGGTPFNCEKCVWMAETGVRCIAFANVYSKEHGSDQSIGSYRVKPTKGWKKIRIKQLTEWIAKYDKGNVNEKDIE